MVGFVIRHQQRRRRSIEETGVAEIVRELPPDFRAKHHRVPDCAGGPGVDDVRLVEDIRPVGGVVVRRQRHRRLGRVDRARNEVLIEPAVVADQRLIAEGDIAPPVFNPHRAQIDARPHVGVGGVSVVSANDRRRRDVPETT